MFLQALLFYSQSARELKCEVDERNLESIIEVEFVLFFLFLIIYFFFFHSLFMCIVKILKLKNIERKIIHGKSTKKKRESF